MMRHLLISAGRVARGATALGLLTIPAWSGGTPHQPGREASAGSVLTGQVAVGQRGNVRGDKPAGCEGLPDKAKHNEGLATLPEDDVKTWLKYADTLCFVETAGGPSDEPASDVKPRSKKEDDKEKILLWILPERHVHQLDADMLRGKNDTTGPRSRIVAKISNADPHGRPFRAWPKELKHGEGPAFILVGPSKQGGTTVSRVIRFTDPWYWPASVDVLQDAAFRDKPYASNPPYHYARAMWGHPPKDHLRGQPPHGRVEILDQHNTGWFDCASGCCSAISLW